MTGQGQASVEQCLESSGPGKRKMASYTLFISFLLASAVAHATLEVEWKAGLLSVTAEGVSRAQLLQEIAHHTGMQVWGLEKLKEKVSVRFSGYSLHKGLQEILAPMNYILIEEKAPGVDGRRTTPVLRVFGSRESAPSQEVISDKDSPQAANLPDPEVQVQLARLHTAAQDGDERTLQEATANPEPAIQTTALELLAEHNPREVVDDLVKATKSQEPKTRLLALELLHSNAQADKQTVLSAFGEAIADKDSGVKAYAIRVLAEQGGPGAGEYLHQALHDGEPSVRLATIDAIVRFLPVAERLTLLQDAAADEDETVRSAASSWLEEVK